MTSNADLFLGVGSAALDQWISTLYGMPQLQGSLFSGSTTQSIAGIGDDVILDWTVTQTPTVTLADPGPLWQQAIGVTGAPPTPVPNAFTVSLPALTLTIQVNGSPPQSATIAPTGLVQATLSGSNVSIAPVGAVVDLNGLSENQQTIYRYLVIPTVLQIVHGLLGGYAIPQLSPLGVALSAPALAVGNGLLLVAMNLGATVPATPSLDTLPPDPVFLLASAAAAQAFVNAGVQQIANTTKSVGGSEGFTLANASYNASLSLGAVTVQLDPADLTRATALVQLSASASAQATALFLSASIGYDASISPSPVPLSIQISASGSNVLATVSPPPPVSIGLTPTGDISSIILSGIAWPLASVIVNLLQPLADQLLVANNPYAVVTIPQTTQSINGVPVTITVNVVTVEMFGQMLKVGGTLTL
ncbi:hypothetical protein ABMY26_04315 [Azospirillum sp. HJ39]|uniref:hypothetical protein n=1 Tax=Azospirillum sp. HJ39 TaxID=3159496 RepID=UPI003555EE3F